MAQKSFNSSDKYLRYPAITYGRISRLAKRIAALLLAASILGFCGCASAPVDPPPPQIDGMSAPQVLYQAILATFDERDLPVETASERHLLVSSTFQPAGAALRKQMTARIVRGMPGAMGLKITTDWQRRSEESQAPAWTPTNSPELNKRAQADELALARAIEARFSAWKGSWSQAEEPQ